eukprot:9318745-Alexandrium_andersonii.AAC.1
MCIRDRDSTLVSRFGWLSTPSLSTGGSGRPTAVPSRPDSKPISRIGWLSTPRRPAHGALTSSIYRWFWPTNGSE